MGLEQVQRRPGLYIGDTADGTGLDTMVAELVGNALIEAPPCNRVEVNLYDGGVVAVCDNGPGLVVDEDAEWNVPTAELLVTQLHAAGKFGSHHDLPRVLYGVGLAVVNALSEEFVVRIWRGGLEYAMRFYLGTFIHRLQCTGAAGNYKGLPRHGTEIAFIASPRFFNPVTYEFARLHRRLCEFQSLKCGATLTLSDRRAGAGKTATIAV